MWGFWWIFPLVGLLICLVAVAAMVRGMGSGRGFTCMGDHRSHTRDDYADLRRELSELREEIKQLKGTR